MDLNYKARALCDTKEMSEFEWLALREHGPDWKNKDSKDYIPYTIGGSAIASVLNISPWLTARGLWRKKKGIKDKVVDDSGTVSKGTGHIWEPYVAQMVNYMPGHEDDLVFEDTNFYQHPLYPFMVANIDRKVIHKGEECILEIKTTNWLNYDVIAGWKKGIIPLYYEFQVRWYMSILNINKAFIICAWGFLPQDMVILEINRNIETEKYLIHAGERFVQSLRDNIEPTFEDADPNLAAEELRRMLGASEKADLVEFSPEYFQDFSLIRDVLLTKEEISKQRKAEDKELDTLLNLMSLEILEKIGDKEGGICKNEDGEIVLLDYKSSYRNTVDSGKLSNLFPDAYSECLKTSMSRKIKYSKRKNKEKTIAK